MSEVTLRAVADDDLPHFFEHQRDPEARRMSAFTSRDPNDRDLFERHWKRIRSDPAIEIRTIVSGGEVAGYVASFMRGDDREVSYWLGTAFWGRGIATAAVSAFVQLLPTRPLHARVVQDHLASRRVLEKCGFVVTGSDRGFAAGRDTEVDEWLFTLE